MSTRAIIDVELNDAAWTKFQAQYKVYEAALANAPAAWAKVNKEIDGSRESFDKLVDAAKARQVQAKLVSDAEKVAADQLKRQTGETTTQARSWSAMAKDSKAFAGNIVTATKSLLRWAEVTGVISGLLGAGGLFGIDRLAQSAAGQRKDASGIRVTPGELRSFDLNFSRLLGNPSGFLTGVSESLSDVTKAAPYGALGLNYGQERNKRPADVAIDVLRAEKALADRTPQSQLGNVFASRQLGMLGQNVEDFQRIKDRPLAEILEYIKQNQGDRKNLDLSQPQLRAWEDFKVQLSRAGDQIEKTFIVALTPLAPQLGHLSKSVSGLVDAFLRNPETAKWLDEAAIGIDNFATYIGTPKFKSDVDGFVHGVGLMADKIVSGLRLLGLIPDAAIPGGNDDKTRDSGGLSGLPPGSPLWNNVPDKEQSNYANSPRSQAFLNPNNDSDRSFNVWDPSTWWHHAPGTGPAPRPSPFPGGAGPSLTPGAFRTMTGGGIPDGITPALLASVEYQESRGRDVTNPRSGAAGYFQFMPGTARQYGVNPHDEQSSLAGAEHYLTDLKKQFGGDTEKALAAYNWGPGNLKRDIAKYGEQWRAHLPRETENYVSQIEGRLPRTAPRTAPQYAHQFKDRSVRVQIHNATGGNANVTLSQLSV